ncbi:lamin tail domain-containing protein [bacterium]|nr:lamin tail domain-containing protein [bacterium]
MTPCPLHPRARRRARPLRAAVLLAALLLVGVAGAASAQEPLIINEILADPASDWDGDGLVDFKGDEWIEVRNVGPDMIDLSTYWLRDDTGTEPHLQLFGELAPEGIAVFYGSDAVAWQAANGYSTTGFSLNNGGDVVRLLRSIPGSEELELMYVAHYEDHMAEDDRSCGWQADMFDWVLFDGLWPYTGSLEPGSTGCVPTPGLPNVCGSVAVEARSFGAVKSLFR